METPKKKIRGKPKGAGGVHSPHAIFAPALRSGKHGLYRDLSKIDGRTRIALIKKSLRNALLERFATPAPAVAQIIADRCALKLLRAASYETFILGGNVPAPSADRDYITLTASIRADIQLLHQMANDGGPADKEPSLKEYLEAIKAGKLIPVEAEKEPDNPGTI